MIRGSTYLPCEQKWRGNEHEFGDHSENEAGASVFLVHRGSTPPQGEKFGSLFPRNQTPPNPTIPPQRRAEEGRGHCGGVRNPRGAGSR